MIRINLAPQVDQTSGRNILIRDVFVIGIVSVASYFFIEFYSERYDTEVMVVENKIAELRNTKANLSKDLERNREIKKRTEEIKIRSSRVRQLGDGRKLSVALMDSLQSKHPERMWFTKIAYSTKNRNLQLTGFALDHTVIADYMKRLREIGKIDASENSELRDFIPPQLLNSDFKQTNQADKVKNETQSLDQVTLKQLISSEELQGVTLQKFEINIRISSG